MSALGEIDRYLIWSNEHRAWWRPNRCGYTVHLAAAGRYSRDDAVNISSRARNGWHEGEPPPEIPVKLKDALECAIGGLARRANGELGKVTDGKTEP